MLQSTNNPGCHHCELDLVPRWQQTLRAPSNGVCDRRPFTGHRDSCAYFVWSYKPCANSLTHTLPALAHLHRYSPSDKSLDFTPSVKAIAGQLATWYSLLPVKNHLMFRLPHVLLLHMLYHYTTILLYRPLCNTASDAVTKCDSAAAEIMRLVKVCGIGASQLMLSDL